MLSQACTLVLTCVCLPVSLLSFINAAICGIKVSFLFACGSLETGSRGRSRWGLKASGWLLGLQWRCTCHRPLLPNQLQGQNVHGSEASPRDEGRELQSPGCLGWGGSGRRPSMTEITVTPPHCFVACCLASMPAWQAGGRFSPDTPFVLGQAPRSRL